MTHEELLQRIEQAKKQGTTYLNLRNNHLRELPLQIAQLSQLKALNLRNNQLREFPPEIGQLSQLQILDLSNNQLSELPFLKNLILGITYFL